MRPLRAARRNVIRSFVRNRMVRKACDQRVSGPERPLRIRLVKEDAVGEMKPGDMILLEETSALRAPLDSGFYAILACPQCCHLDLITQAQFAGAASVLCGHADCSCHFNIIEKTSLAYLPLN
jgi:hypothetical protein